MCAIASLEIVIRPSGDASARPASTMSLTGAPGDGLQPLLAARMMVTMMRPLAVLVVALVVGVAAGCGGTKTVTRTVTVGKKAAGGAPAGVRQFGYLALAALYA